MYLFFEQCKYLEKMPNLNFAGRNRELTTSVEMKKLPSIFSDGFCIKEEGG